ncbi:MAG: hypothetical protein GKR97_09395 [Rhizobiaceae bacterium]|nr:hypothetical protein [Rhizobiaceae bacterium]
MSVIAADLVAVLDVMSIVDGSVAHSLVRRVRGHGSSPDCSDLIMTNLPAFA